MATILLVSGSLSRPAVLRFLESPGARGATVLEFDSVLDRHRYPAVARWWSTTDLMDKAMRDSIDATTREWAGSLFGRPPGPDEIVGRREFRMAAFGVSQLVCLLAAATNLRLGGALLREGRFDRIVVGPGTGVNLPVWRHMAREHSLALEILQMEKPPWRIASHFRKLRGRTGKKASTGLRREGTRIADLPRHPEILCASRLVGNLLLKVGHLRDRGIEVIHSKELTQFEGEAAKRLDVTYADWYDAYQDTALCPAGQEIVSKLARAQATDLYPSHALIYQRAQEVLGRIQPRALLCDTQRGGPERMWTLAARDLGVPVIGYTYDHLLDPDYFMVPDFLISDSGRNTLNAVKAGMAESHIAEAVSHRLVKTAGAPVGGSRKVVFSDNFYAGDQCRQDPRVSYALYQAAVCAARAMSDTEVVVKFHPLRQKKSEMRGFIGMDEQELRVRKRFIRSLDTPANFRTCDPEADMQEILKGAGALVNIESLTGVEAFCHGIPVIFLRPPSPQDFPLLEEYGGALYPTAGRRLEELLESVLPGGDRRERLLENQRRYSSEFYWRSRVPLAEAALNLAESARSKTSP